MKLMSMTDFVLEQNKIGMEIQSLTHQQSDRARRFYLISKYAKFLKQPLTLGMFVTCDDKGNVLNEKLCDFNKYQQAKERVFFDGMSKMKLTSLYGEKVIKYGKDINFNNESIFEIRNNEVKMFYENIESIIHFDLTLTETAIKQIGL